MQNGNQPRNRRPAPAAGVEGNPFPPKGTTTPGAELPIANVCFDGRFQRVIGPASDIANFRHSKMPGMTRSGPLQNAVPAAPEDDTTTSNGSCCASRKTTCSTSVVGQTEKSSGRAKLVRRSSETGHHQSLHSITPARRTGTHWLCPLPLSSRTSAMPPRTSQKRPIPHSCSAADRYLLIA
jgi:hypothetical protein